MTGRLLDSVLPLLGVVLLLPFIAASWVDYGVRRYLLLEVL